MRDVVYGLMDTRLYSKRGEVGKITERVLEGLNEAGGDVFYP